MAMEEPIQVTTTIDSEEKARALAQAILEHRLGACVQIHGPLQSFYWWKGKIEHAPEWILTIKTENGRYRELENLIRTHHPYETPEIIAIPIVDGSRDYLDWLRGETKKTP